MKFHLRDYLMEEIGRLEVLSDLDASVYKQFNLHIKTAYRGSSTSRATGRQNTVKSTGWRQRCELHTISTDVESISKSVVHS